MEQNDKIPLNQAYRCARTFRDYPEIKDLYDEISKVSKSVGFVRPSGIPKGRVFDDAVLLYICKPFITQDTRIVELGARDGILCAFLAQTEASQIVVSDYFEKWEGLGSLMDWRKTWLNACYEVGVDTRRLLFQKQDMTKLSFKDDEFDMVFSTSVIEHLYNQCMGKDGKGFGDIKALDEMVRVCKNGGLLALSTDIHCKTETDEIIGHSGTWYYSEKALWDRLLNHPKVTLLEKRHAFHVDEECDDIYSHGPVQKCAAVVFVLRVNK